MNVAYDLEFDLDGFLRSLEKGRSARQRVKEYRDAPHHEDDEDAGTENTRQRRQRGVARRQGA
jgi:hypothetical protein